MIISASRRTDIPAFYGPWLVNRLRAGSVMVRNPFNRHQVTRVRLTPQETGCLVLWTKNPAPLLPHLQTITELGYSMVFHYTLTGCDPALEPGLPSLEERIATFRALSGILGPQRVLWRFDPIVLTKAQGPQDWLHRFADLAGRLNGVTKQCTISFVSLYAKCRRHLAGIGLLNVEEAVKRALVSGMAQFATCHGIRLVACCDPFVAGQCGIEQAHCIDAMQLGVLLGRDLVAGKDTGQRPGCGCSRSIDIGAYDSCSHGCRYCYATTSFQAAGRNMSFHDPDSPLLIGQLRGDERIRDREIVASIGGQPRQLPLPTGGQAGECKTPPLNPDALDSVLSSR